MLELKKISEHYLPKLRQQFDHYWQNSDEYGLVCGKHMRAAITGVLFAIFGVVVLSFDGDKRQPGTAVVRDRIFGIEQRYFLVYFNGLLLYLALLYYMEDDPITPASK